jgi:trans-2,3-dihydro-3-hydroxyanthranilate isomerase
MPDQNPLAYRFRTVDVFTQRLFGGNQLVVFYDGTGLTTADMRNIAREMNVSETAFVFPPSLPGSYARVRIFTPFEELPFAGHPTIGTAFVLAANRSLSAGTRSLVLEEGVGPVTVRFSQEADRQLVVSPDRC